MTQPRVRFTTQPRLRTWNPRACLAADYPSVIDYSLRDGKDRLQAALESLTTVLRTGLRIEADEPKAHWSQRRQCEPSQRCTRR
jgi:hypothetical protein